MIASLCPNAFNHPQTAHKMWSNFIRIIAPLCGIFILLFYSPATEFRALTDTYIELDPN